MTKKAIKYLYKNLFGTHSDQKQSRADAMNWHGSCNANNNNRTWPNRNKGLGT
jgi:hypothetical protein